MRITKDILNYLNVTGIYIVKSGEIHVCVPVEVEGSVWRISTDTQSLSGTALIHIKRSGQDHYFKVEVVEQTAQDNFAFTYIVRLKDPKEQDLFLMEFAVIEQKMKGWEKRREERYEVGFDEERIKAFRLKTYEQKVIVNRLTLPCVLNDISFSGAKLTTVDSHFSKERRVFLFLSFTSPIEQVLVPARIKAVALREVAGQMAATLSLEFEEAPIAYKQRVADFVVEMRRTRRKNVTEDLPGAEDNNMDIAGIPDTDDALKAAAAGV